MGEEADADWQAGLIELGREHAGASKCIEGVEIAYKARCSVCGAYEFQPCGLRAERNAKERAKRAADRAARRSLSSTTAAKED